MVIGGVQDAPSAVTVALIGSVAGQGPAADGGLMVTAGMLLLKTPAVNGQGDLIVPVTEPPVVLKKTCDSLVMSPLTMRGAMPSAWNPRPQLEAPGHTPPLGLRAWIAEPLPVAFRRPVALPVTVFPLSPKTPPMNVGYVRLTLTV